MVQIIGFLAIITGLILLIVLRKKASEKTIGIIIKTLSIIVFVTYGFLLFQKDAIDSVIGNTGCITGLPLILIIVLRWMTVAAVVIFPVLAWYKIKSLNNIASFIYPVVSLLNWIFFRLHILASLGTEDYQLFNVRVIFTIILFSLISILSLYYLLQKILDKDFTDIRKQLPRMFIAFACILLSVFPQYALQALFGEAGFNCLDFKLPHRMMIYVAIFAPLIITGVMRNKSYEEKCSLLVLVSLSGFVQYFYTYTFKSFITPTGLPFHLCNTAIILIILSYVFKIKGVFYFTYLVNVVGALFAILMPNTGESDFFSLHLWHFWFNHWYAFFMPILGITLGIYKRPNFAMIRKAIGIYSIYLVLMIVLNGWLYNYDPNVDYFFLNKNFIVDKLEVFRPIKESYVLRIPITNGIVFKTYWLYDICVYVAYIIFILVTWAVYAYTYKITDHYTEAAMLMKMDVLEIAKLKKECGGNLENPMDKENTDKIIISHFSKRYEKGEKFAVKDFSLEVHCGEVFGFLGHNGAGKSTTIKSLVGIQSITEGSMEICGYDVTKQPLMAKKQIGYVSDNHAVYEHLTGREYINYVADLYEVSLEDRNKRIEKYSEMFKLTDALDREIKGYSHGMKQKIMVISALLHNPKVWILDEPLTGLDPTSAYEIKECMKEHAKAGNIVFFSSHVIEVVEKVCDRIAIISHGELKGVYDLKELKEQGVNLEELYMSFME